MPSSRECAGVNVEVPPALRPENPEARRPGFRLPDSAEPAVGHDQFNLLVLDRITPHFAAIGVNSAVTVDPVERGGADAHHHQWLLARCLEPVEGAVR